MAHNDLVKNAEKYVSAYYEAHVIAGIYFHDLQHTKSVLKAIKSIAAQSGLPKADTQFLKIAAWFQYTGYLESPEHSEEASAELARNFLIQEKAGDEALRVIPALLVAKASENYPSGKLEEILFDACHSYMSQKSFLDKSRALKLEEEFFKHQEIGKTEWLRQRVTAFENHRYYTVYGRTEFTPKRNRNLAKLKKELWMRELALAEKHAEPAEKGGVIAHPEKEATERGIDTLLQYFPFRPDHFHPGIHDRILLPASAGSYQCLNHPKFMKKFFFVPFPLVSTIQIALNPNALCSTPMPGQPQDNIIKPVHPYVATFVVW